MKSSVDQEKVKSRSKAHVWHALWHALGDIAGKAGPILYREYPNLKAKMRVLIENHSTQIKGNW